MKYIKLHLWLWKIKLENIHNKKNQVYTKKKILYTFLSHSSTNETYANVIYSNNKILTYARPYKQQPPNQNLKK